MKRWFEILPGVYTADPGTRVFERSYPRGVWFPNTPEPGKDENRTRPSSSILSLLQQNLQTCSSLYALAAGGIGRATTLLQC